MGEIFILLGELLLNFGKQLAISLGIASATSAITALLNGQSGGSSWVQLSNEVGTSLSEIENPTYGLAQLRAQLDAIEVSLAALTPVTLPPTYPSGWSTQFQTDVGSGVWDAQIGPHGTIANTLLNSAALGFNAISGYFSQDGTFGYFLPSNLGDVQSGLALLISYPTFDPSTIGADADLLASVTRQNPSFYCVWFSGTGSQVLLLNNPVGGVQWLTTFDNAGFDRLQTYLYTPSSGPPVRSVEGDTKLLLSLIPLQY